MPTNDPTTPSVNPVWTLIVGSTGLTMAFLDALVLTTALPTLRQGLHGNLGNLEWTVNAYNLTFACLLLTGAALGDRFGRRRVMTIGVTTFVVASLAAGLAPTIDALIAARALQGAGAALMVPLTLTLITNAYPPERRGWAIGVWGGMGGLSGAVGPFLGGSVVQALSWHWIFWINVPIGVALIPMLALKVRESHGRAPRLDLVGVALVTTGLFAIVWGLIAANTRAWLSVPVVAALVVGVALLTAFLVWEHRASHPMIPLTLFKIPSFSLANITSFCLFGGLFGALFLMSQFFQVAQHKSAFAAGCELLIWSATGLFVAPLTGRLADRVGNRGFMLAGLVMQMSGLGAVALIAHPHTSVAVLAGPLVIAGMGTAMVFPTVANEVMSSVTAERAGIASGANNALRELGGVFGVAVLATAFNRPGVYATPQAFTSGFRDALWVAVVFSGVGLLAAISLALTRRGTAGPAERATATAATSATDGGRGAGANRRGNSASVSRSGHQR